MTHLFPLTHPFIHLIGIPAGNWLVVVASRPDKNICRRRHLPKPALISVATNHHGPNPFHPPLWDPIDSHSAERIVGNDDGIGALTSGATQSIWRWGKRIEGEKGERAMPLWNSSIPFLFLPSSAVHIPFTTERIIVLLSPFLWCAFDGDSPRFSKFPCENPLPLNPLCSKCPQTIPSPFYYSILLIFPSFICPFIAVSCCVQFNSFEHCAAIKVLAHRWELAQNNKKICIISVSIHCFRCKKKLMAFTVISHLKGKIVNIKFSNFNELKYI